MMFTGTEKIDNQKTFCKTTFMGCFSRGAVGVALMPSDFLLHLFTMNSFTYFHNWYTMWFVLIYDWYSMFVGYSISTNLLFGQDTTIIAWKYGWSLVCLVIILLQFLALEGE